MGIGRTARGTFSGTTPSGSITTGSVTVGATGSCLVVWIACLDGGNGTFDGVTWNGQSFSSLGSNGPGPVLSGVYLANVTAGSYPIVVDLTSAGTWDSYAITVTEVTGCTTAPADKFKGANGSSATPSTGASAALAQAAEIVIAACVWQNTAIGGTWGNSFNAGQNDTAGAGLAAVAIEEGYKTVAATTAVTANKTSAPNKAWAIRLATFKEGSVAPQTGTPGFGQGVATALAAVALAGLVTASCGHPTGTATAHGVTAICGPVSTSAGTATGTSFALAVTETANRSVGVDLAPARASAWPVTTASSRPSAIEDTPLAVLLDGESSPMTLRAVGTLGNLGDQQLDTYETAASVLGTTPGTMTIDAGGFANTGIAGSGAISGVVFYAFARVTKDAHATVSNFRTAFPSGTFSAPPQGTYASVAEFGVVSTELVTTMNGTDPWTWASLFSALAAVELRATYSFSGGHQFDEFAQLEVAELWCEVRGPIGTPQVEYSVPLKMGEIIVPLTMPAEINGGQQ